MTALFSIDCHACGAKNTIDTETIRRVGRPSVDVNEVDELISKIDRTLASSRIGGCHFHCTCPEPAA